MKFYRDENNAPCASDEGDLAVLADFLQSDIQGDRTSAIDLLQFLEKKAGERTGNAYTAMFGPQDVVITDLYGEETSQSINRNIFFQAVEAWIVFIGD